MSPEMMQAIVDSQEHLIKAVGWLLLGEVILIVGVAYLYREMRLLWREIGNLAEVLADIICRIEGETQRDFDDTDE